MIISCNSCLPAVHRLAARTAGCSLNPRCVNSTLRTFWVLNRWGLRTVYLSVSFVNRLVARHTAENYTCVKKREISDAVVVCVVSCPIFYSFIWHVGTLQQQMTTITHRQWQNNRRNTIRFAQYTRKGWARERALRRRPAQVRLYFTLFTTLCSKFPYSFVLFRPSAFSFR